MPRLEHRNEKALGYAIHTNRELGLMLKGQKPLAAFADGYGYFPEAVTRYLRLFDRHVERGALAKREYVELGRSAPGIHVILYAIPGEEWRFEAMQDLRWRTDWGSDTCERIEGSLLGYTDQQNELWLARRHAPPPATF